MVSRIVPLFGFLLLFSLSGGAQVHPGLCEMFAPAATGSQGWYDAAGRYHGSPDLRSAVPLHPLKPMAFLVPVYVSELNTPYDDTSPHISGDGLRIVFGSSRPGSLGGGDIWEATRPDRWASFGAPVHLGNGVNTGSQESQPSLTADRLEIFFMRAQENSWESTDIYRASRISTDEPFATAVPVSELNTAGAEAYPYISPDGLTLCFASNRPGGTGSCIWFAARGTRISPFGVPQLMPGVNSPMDDIAFSMRADGLVGYLASRRDGPNTEIYECHRSSLHEEFGTPSLIADLASPGFDSGPSVTADGMEMYFFSTRSGETEDYNIWASIDPAVPIQTPTPPAPVTGVEVIRWMSLAN